MGIQNFPAALQPIIQQGYLEHRFEQALRAKLGYRAIADREDFTIGIGETLTKTRAGLLAAATTPLAPATNTNFDNGMSPDQYAVEQYTVTINAYGKTLDLNTVTSRVGIANQFVQNAYALGENAGRTLDTLAQNALFNVYLGGNTRVRTTLGAPATTVSVDDIRGFQIVFVNGVQTPVSAGNPLAVTVGADAYSAVGATADGSNVSTAPGGISGTLTFSGNVTVADGTAGNAVVSGIAPSIIRPNSKATTAALVATDTLLLNSCINQAATNLRLNAVPDIDGFYHCYVDAQQLQGLFADPDFKELYRGGYGSDTYRKGTIIELLGIRYIPTNNTPQQTLGGLKVRRGLVCGKGALVEGDFPLDNPDTDNPLAETSTVDGVRMVTRAPMDRAQEIVAQTWKWIGGFSAPSDTTANPTVLPTATNSAFKRAVVIESV